MNKKTIKSTAGNSLAEFAVVIALMATLMSTGQVKFSQAGEGGKGKKTGEELDKLSKAARGFYNAINDLEGAGRFPGQDKWDRNVPGQSKPGDPNGDGDPSDGVVGDGSASDENVTMTVGHGYATVGQATVDIATNMQSYTDALENILKENKNARRKLIITDGVFSMDGDIAPLGLIAELAEQYDAMVMVDDCHGEGVLGDGGRGIVDHFKLQGKIDFEIGSFSKALGVQGGVLSCSESVKKHAINHSRSWLLSGSQPPGVAAAQKAAIEVLRDEPEHHAKLWNNTEYFRNEMQSLGFDTGVSETPIIPVMCGESRLAKKLSEELYKKGIFALPIVFPMVAKDKARIRCMISSGLTKEDLDIVIGSFSEVGKLLGII